MEKLMCMEESIKLHISCSKRLHYLTDVANILQFSAFTILSQSLKLTCHLSSFFLHWAIKIPMLWSQPLKLSLQHASLQECLPLPWSPKEVVTLGITFFTVENSQSVFHSHRKNENVSFFNSHSFSHNLTNT